MRLLFLNIFLCLSLYCFILNAKVLKVESLELLGQRDMTAQTQPRYDLNGNTCALIKVSLPDNVKFEGNIIDNIYDINEHLVYVTPGTKNITIKCSGYETLYFSVSSTDFPNGLESGRTYRLMVSGIENPNSDVLSSGENDYDYNNSQTMIINIEPKDASVLINGIKQNLNKNCQLTIDLPLGTHSYRISRDKYYPAQGQINLNDENKIFEKNINLKPKFGFISILSTPEIDGATIEVDGKYIGLAPLNNQPIDNGKHIVGITKKLFKTYIEDIYISDSISVIIRPNLIPIYGDIELSLNVENALIKHIRDGKIIEQYKTPQSNYLRTKVKIDQIEYNDIVGIRHPNYKTKIIKFYRKEPKDFYVIDLNPGNGEELIDL